MSHYDTLEVQPHASHDVIGAAFDVLMSRSDLPKEIAGRIQEAADVVGDPIKRAEYDTTLFAGVQGTVIGDFKVESAIAEGGFGKTYLGTHVLLGEKVCIKHCSRISALDATILMDEAKAMWDLRHFAIPAVRNVIKLDDGSLALVMSYVEGPTLAELVEGLVAQKKKIDPEDVAWIAQRIINALSYIHRHGVVHGDLKPQNIIVQEKSHMVVLVDFGLAAVRPTKSTGSKGYTDVFSPPEQVKGSPLLPQTDFYSLGMTMIYALTGGDEKHILAREVPDTVPEPLSKFIRRLIVRSPLGRPDWSNEDLNDTIVNVRMKAFGRISTGMKKI